MKLKNLAALALCAAFALGTFGVAACSSKNDDNDNTDVTNTDGGNTNENNNENNNGSTAHVHTLTKTDAVAATCTAEGNSAYWYCSGCQKYFSDENATNEITLASTVTAKIAHTYVAKHDSASHWDECSVCGDIKDKESHSLTSGTCSDCGYTAPEYSTADFTIQQDDTDTTYFYIYLTETGIAKTELTIPSEYNGTTITNASIQLYTSSYDFGVTETIYIPASMTTVSIMGQRLQNVLVDSANTALCSVDGVVYSKDKTALVYYPSGKLSYEYTIPDTVTTIKSGAIVNMEGLDSTLRKLTIPASVTMIESNGLYAGNSPIIELYNYSNITITENTADEGNAASGNGYIYNVYTNSSTESKITESGDYVFYTDADGKLWLIGEYSGNTEITLPEVEGGYAVMKCAMAMRGYTKVTIPSCVTTLGQSAFEGCTSLTTVIIAEGVTTIDQWCFSNCSALVSVNIPVSVTYIGSSAFGGCDSLTAAGVTVADTAGWYDREGNAVSSENVASTIADGDYLTKTQPSE